MNLIENLTNYTTINQIPNSKPFVISTESLILVGETLNFEQYNQLINSFSSVIDQATASDTENDDDSDTNNSSVYKIAAV